MDLDGLELFDGFGPDRIRLTGSYTPEELADQMTQSWIPFLECHRCGRFSYCKFVQKKPDFPSQAYDIKCGVVAAVINNFVQALVPLIPDLEVSERQELLDAAFYLVMFTHDTELHIGHLMSDNLLEFWGSLTPSFFTFVVRQRETLDRLAGHLTNVPSLQPNRVVVLVEGESERALIGVFQGHTVSNLDDIVVDVYGDRGSVWSKSQRGEHRGERGLRMCRSPNPTVLGCFEMVPNWRCVPILGVDPFGCGLVLVSIRAPKLLRWDRGRELSYPTHEQTKQPSRLSKETFRPSIEPTGDRNWRSSSSAGDPSMGT